MTNFLPSPPNPSYSSVLNPSPPFQTIDYQIESPLFVVKQRENWAEINQQRFHDETLQRYGEECVVRLLWRAEDAAAGLVTYCIECQDSPNPSNPDTAIQNRLSQAYRQTGNSYCPYCYGTTFTGGFKPVAYHLYMLAADTPEVRRDLLSGQFWQQTPQVQMSWYPQIRRGDLLIRINNWNGDTPTLSGDRFQVSTVAIQSLRTGPGPSNNTTKIISQNATLESLPPEHPLFSVPYV